MQSVELSGSIAVSTRSLPRNISGADQKILMRKIKITGDTIANERHPDNFFFRPEKKLGPPGQRPGPHTNSTTTGQPQRTGRAYWKNPSSILPIGQEQPLRYEPTVFSHCSETETGGVRRRYTLTEPGRTGHHRPALVRSYRYEYLLHVGILQGQSVKGQVYCVDPVRNFIHIKNSLGNSAPGWQGA